MNTQTKGFTLIELLVVVLMIGVLTSVALPQYRKALDRSKVAEAEQMLPAIFEARERWMIENGLTVNTLALSGYSIKNAAGETVTPTFDKLDIESKGVASGKTLTTKNFQYNMFPGNKLKGVAHYYVSAVPQWGENRIKGKVTLYYDGEVLKCSGDEAVCNRLNLNYNHVGKVIGKIDDDLKPINPGRPGREINF